jgi:CBS domain containing-hemolysin-like protein
VFAETGYSRLPVYEGERGNVVGILSVHELVRWRDRAGVRQNLRPPYSISPDAPIVDVLMEMKERGRHMATIHDGDRVVGVTTMEDILSRFVGAIDDKID